MKSLIVYYSLTNGNTKRIADRCHVELETGTLHLPAFSMEGVSDNIAFFQALCEKACKNAMERLFQNRCEIACSEKCK